MTSSEKLSHGMATGIHRIGEIEIETTVANECFKLFHHADLALTGGVAGGGLTIYDGSAAAREIAAYAADGSYRFLKAQRNLRRGWLLRLASVAELRMALDQFYPACVGLWLAQQEGTLEVTPLRDTLQRQSGMYRRVQALDDTTLQALVPRTCSPAIPCARHILWQLDAGTPLLPSAASHCRGIGDDVAAAEAIPLLCREACNHFVAACLASAKAAAAQTD
ncbi:MAG: DR2241 family protein [Verrucomicrobiota bacterium]